MPRPRHKLSHYRLVEKIGEGGMGVVWKAEDTKLGRPVAVKILPEAVSSDPQRLARFEREARVLASLSHQNIAAIHQVEEVDGRAVLVIRPDSHWSWGVEAPPFEGGRQAIRKVVHDGSSAVA